MEHIEIEISWGGEDYVIEGEANVYIEHYGADADGNRGVHRRVFEFDNCKVSKVVGDDLVEIPEEEINAEFQKEIDRRVESQISDLD